MTTYETTQGTKPQAYAQHEPRTIVRHETDGDLHMMTEIGDGVFVQWSNCRRCNARVYDCKCSEGPQEPPYMQKWRDERFERELNKRPDPDYPMLESARGHGYTVTTSAEVEQQAAPKVDLDEAIERARTAKADPTPEWQDENEEGVARGQARSEDWDDVDF